MGLHGSYLRVDELVGTRVGPGHVQTDIVAHLTAPWASALLLEPRALVSVDVGASGAAATSGAAAVEAAAQRVGAFTTQRAELLPAYAGPGAQLR